MKDAFDLLKTLPLGKLSEEQLKELNEALVALNTARSSEAVERDAARLDDMERTKCYPFWNGDGWTYIVAAERSSKIERKGIGPTVRAAIDAAMSAQPVSDGKA